MCTRLTILTLVALLSFIAAPLHAVELKPDDAEKLQQAQQAREAGQHQRAIELLTELRKTYPNLADLPRLQAHSYFELQQYDQARTAALDAVALGRIASDMLTRLVQIDQQRGDDVATLNTVRLLTITDSGNPAWRILYGDLLTAMNRPAEAEAIYRRSLEAHPARAAWWARLGNVLARQNRDTEAAGAFETAWRLGQRDTTIAQNLAGLHQRLGDTAAALHWIEQLLSMQSTPSAATQLRRAQLLFQLDRHDTARNVATPLTQSSDQPTAGQAHLLLGRIAQAADDPDAMLEHFKAAHAAGVANPALLLAVGKLHLNRGEFALAERFLSQYIDTAAADRDTLLLLARSAAKADPTGRRARKVIHLYLEHFGLDGDVEPLIIDLPQGGGR